MTRKTGAKIPDAVNRWAHIKGCITRMELSVKSCLREEDKRRIGKRDDPVTVSYFDLIDVLGFIEEARTDFDRLARIRAIASEMATD